MTDTRPIVALGLLTYARGGKVAVRVVPLLEGEDPRAAAEVLVRYQHADVVAALTRVLDVAELAKYVPCVARCPDVAWIAASCEEGGT